jgi:hypothetical protein
VDEDTRPGMEWNRHIVDSDGNTVCFMAYSDSRKLLEHDAARARLVAAVPAMLDALVKLHRICRDCDLEHEAERPTEEQYTEAMDAAESALAAMGPNVAHEPQADVPG